MKAKDLAGCLAELIENHERGDNETVSGIARDNFPFQKREPTPRKPVYLRDRLRIYARDRYQCRYFGDRLLFPGVLEIIRYKFGATLFPADTKWRVANSHWIYWKLCPVVDHKQCSAMGGESVSSDSNLVTTSMFRNTQKMHWSLDDMGWRDRGEEGADTQWDGLVGWFRSHMASASNGEWEDPQIKRWCGAIQLRRGI